VSVILWVLIMVDYIDTNPQRSITVISFTAKSIQNQYEHKLVILEYYDQDRVLKLTRLVTRFVIISTRVLR